jgi:hypothetical protein
MFCIVLVLTMARMYAVQGSPPLDSQTELLNAWASRRFFYVERNATCVCLTFMEQDGALYACADPNYRDPNSNKAPIHIAAEYASVEVLSVFISDPDTGQLWE